MDEHIANTPHATAAMLEITPVTLRRWCEYHAAHLSPVANPLPGKARRFTGRDVEVLKHVRSLRARGLTVNDINEQLAGLTFAVIDTDEQGADSGELAPSDAPGGLQPALAPMVASEYIMTIERRFEALEAAGKENKQNQRDAIYLIAIGITIGLAFSALMIGLAGLYGGN